MMTTFLRSCAIVIINHSKQDFRVNGSDLSLNVCSFARPTFRDAGESHAQRRLNICSGCCISIVLDKRIGVYISVKC
jgi:hypothetical protein